MSRALPHMWPLSSGNALPHLLSNKNPFLTKGKTKKSPFLKKAFSPHLFPRSTPPPFIGGCEEEDGGPPFCEKPPLPHIVGPNPLGILFPTILSDKNPFL